VIGFPFALHITMNGSEFMFDGDVIRMLNVKPGSYSERKR
jgi:hypothetical protein